eukprot:Anaeramoba_ignava/a218641_14.p1 GENE.a218641_14~~a218641_14.p1  ORF type:complete len:335 (+),score=2.71 a218641_14:884-1888(+)
MVSENDRRLLVHVGMPKTGSSHIQRILNLNKEKLRAAGYSYDPDKGVDHCADITSIVAQGIEIGAGCFSKYLEQLLEKARSKDCNNLVISSECLFERPKWVSEEIRKFAEKYDFHLHVILYIRDLSSYLIAAWQQWYIKSPDYNCFDKFIETFNGPKYWPSHIKKWKSVAHSITVKPYIRSTLKDHDIAKDFFGEAHIECDRFLMDYRADPKDFWAQNRSFNQIGVELLGALKETAHGNIHDHRQQIFLTEYFGDLVFEGDGIKLSSKQLKVCQERFESSMEEIVENGESLMVLKDMLYNYETSSEVSEVENKLRNEIKDEVIIRFFNNVNQIL